MMGSMISCICAKYDVEDDNIDVDDDMRDSRDMDLSATSDTIHEKDDSCEEFVMEQMEINRMFPNARFVIAIPLNEMEQVISHLDKIIIKQTYTCYCYDNFMNDISETETTDNDTIINGRPPPKWFPIHCQEGQKMTNKYVIKELIRQGLTLSCNHCFLEGIEPSLRGGDCQFELVTCS